LVRLVGLEHLGGGAAGLHLAEQAHGQSSSDDGGSREKRSAARRHVPFPRRQSIADSAPRHGAALPRLAPSALQGRSTTVYMAWIRACNISQGRERDVKSDARGRMTVEGDG